MLIVFKGSLLMLAHLFLMLAVGFSLGVVYIEKTNQKYGDLWGVGIFCTFIYALVDSSSSFGSDVAVLAFINLLIGMFLATKHWSKSKEDE